MDFDAIRFENKIKTNHFDHVQFFLQNNLHLKYLRNKKRKLFNCLIIRHIYKIISRDTKMMKLQADLKSERNKDQRWASKDG